MTPRFQSLWMVGLLGLALLALGIDRAAASDSDPLFDIYSFSVEVETEIPNDLMQATLAVTAENADPAALADTINQRMAQALEQLKDYPAIRSRSLNYQTVPRYEGNNARRIIGWSGSQTLRLETDDFGLAARALQELQADLQLQNMQLTTSRGARQAAEDKLVEEALQAFRQRAEQIQQAMQAAAYRVVDIQLGNETRSPRPLRQAPMAMEARSARGVEAPAVQAGTSTVQVRVDGRVQLQ